MIIPKSTSEPKSKLLKFLITGIAIFFNVAFLVSILFLPFLQTRRVIESTVYNTDIDIVRQDKYWLGDHYYYLKSFVTIKEYSITSRSVKICYSSSVNTTKDCYKNNKIFRFYLTKKYFFTFNELESEDTFMENTLNFFKVMLCVFIPLIFFFICFYGTLKSLEWIKTSPCRKPAFEKTSFYLDLNGVNNFPLTEKFYSLLSNTTEDEKEVVEEVDTQNYPFSFVAPLLILIFTYIITMVVQFFLFVTINIELAWYAYLIYLVTSFFAILFTGFDYKTPNNIAHTILTDKAIIYVTERLNRYDLERFDFNDIDHVEFSKGYYSIHSKDIDPKTGKVRVCYYIKVDPKSTKIISKLSSFMNQTLPNDGNSEQSPLLNQ